MLTQTSRTRGLQLANIAREQRAEQPTPRQQQAIVPALDRLAVTAVLSSALLATRNANATGQDKSDQQKLQELKANTLDKAAEEIQSGRGMTANEINAIGRFVSGILPSGSMGNALDQNDLFGRGAVSRFGNRTGGINTVDTHEHYRVSRELKRLKKEALTVRLNTQANETETYRQARNKELIDYNVKLQTLPFARA